MTLTDAFCGQYLNAEYKRLVHKLVEEIAEETPSPLLRGRSDIWASGVVYAIGAANYLFDRSFKPYISAANLAAAFGVAAGSAAQKAAQLRDRYPIDFPNTEFATKKMREMSENMAGMLGQSGWLFDNGNISVQMVDPDGSMVRTDQFRFAPRSPGPGDGFIDADRPVMHDFYEATQLLEEPEKTPLLVKKLEELIAADSDFYDTYLMLRGHCRGHGRTLRHRLARDGVPARAVAYHR